VRIHDKALMPFILILIGLGLSFSTAWSQEDDVLKAQQLLNALGYDAGIADGVIGPLTRQAITAYQRAQNLPATGELDEATLGALGLLEAPLAPPRPPAPTPPPAAWRTVLIYLRYYDTQPSRLVPYVTEHFRQGLGARAWIEQTMRDLAAQHFSRLSWRIERVAPSESDAAATSTVAVYSRVRIAGEEMARREVFSLVRADATLWLLDDVQRLAVTEADPQARERDEATSAR